MRNALLATLFAGLLAACGGADASVSTDFEVNPTRVVLMTGNGSVTVDGTTSGSGSSVAHEQNSDDANVQVEIDENDVMTVSDDCGADADCEVNYRINLTGDTDLDITTAEGTVSIGELTGAITVTTTGGDVNVATSVGDLQISTGGGDVLVTRMESSAAAVETAGGIADVTFDEPITDLFVNTEGGRLTAQLPGGPYALDIDAGGGSTSVLVDDDDNASMSAVLQSGGGNITVYRR